MDDITTENIAVYKNMYYMLFNYITDALECDNIEEIKSLLCKAQSETEEIYISQ